MNYPTRQSTIVGAAAVTLLAFAGVAFGQDAEVAEEVVSEFAIAADTADQMIALYQNQHPFDPVKNQSLITRALTQMAPDLSRMMLHTSLSLRPCATVKFVNAPDS